MEEVTDMFVQDTNYLTNMPIIFPADVCSVYLAWEYNLAIFMLLMYCFVKSACNV